MNIHFCYHPNRMTAYTMKSGQDDMREALAQKAEKTDIHRVEQKLDKSNKHFQDHEARLEALEEEQRSTHKN